MPMSIEQARLVGMIFRKFHSTDEESKEWNPRDEFMCYLSELSDREVAIEAEDMTLKHNAGNARCNMDHPKSECIVPQIVEAMTYILDDFEDTGRLPKKTRFMLEFYISLSKTGAILYDKEVK